MLCGFDDVFIMVICPLLHNAKLGKDSIFNCLDKVVEGLGNDNLTKVIMEVLTIDGGLPKDQIAQKLICFRANGVDVF